VAHASAQGGPSGDGYLVLPSAEGLLAAVADGLGHGEAAATASQLCLETLREVPTAPLGVMVRMCHERLRGTRGAALCVARIDQAGGRMRWLAVGNVMGVLLRSETEPGARPSRSHLLQQAGAIGVRLPSVQSSSEYLSRGDIVLLATDGIHGSFADTLGPKETTTGMADRILARHARPGNDSLILVLRYDGERSG
jgi:serine phosphatase RsbU (regulator of sigma subunit)